MSQCGKLHHAAQEGEVYILPTIRINEGQYRGKLSYTEVPLRTSCSTSQGRSLLRCPPRGNALARWSLRSGTFGVPPHWQTEYNNTRARQGSCLQSPCRSCVLLYSSLLIS